jgi:enoyl-CoA hydratase/carnithine racemase
VSLNRYPNTRYEVEGCIAVVTYDRPDRLNAMTAEMVDELLDVADRIDEDDDVRVAIFTGAGRAFCAGADMADDGAIFDRGQGEFDMAEHADGGGTLTRRLADCRKPLIAAINGAAIGMGLSTTLAMDVRLASDQARFGFVFAKRGLAPDAGSSWLLPRTVGMSQAAQWIFTGRVFDADEALRGGLVSSVHPADELGNAARRLAAQMCEGTAPVAVALTRRLLWRMQTGDLARAHELESRALFALGSGPDVKEGVSAYMGKRPPAFPLRVSAELPRLLAEWPAG